MNTKDLLNKIETENKNIYMEIVSLKKWYNRAKGNNTELAIPRAEIRGFLNGLRLCGFISESDSRKLHCYITL